MGEFHPPRNQALCAFPNANKPRGMDRARTATWGEFRPGSKKLLMALQGA